MQTATHAAVEALQNAKRFNLTFKNAAEDIPRLITCYGRCCGGELALVLRPDEGRGTFVKVQKDKALAAWWGADGGPDAPKEPEYELEPRDAVKRIKVEQMAVPRAGAITLKGQWKGHLTCQPSGHQVVLQRKIASYGNLFIMSSEGRWTWRVVRDERWFTPGREKWGGSRPTMKEAIQAGLADAMNVLGDACSVRDSHRRAALDTDYAAEHPIQPAKEGKDPIERLKERPEKVSKARRKKGEAGLSLVPAPLASPLALPAPPARLDDLREAAGALSEEASAYTRLKDSGWTQSYTAPADLWYGALLEARLDEVVTRIQDWFDSPSIKPAELLEELHAQLEDRDLTTTDRERAVEALDQLERELKRGPALLTRARWLIRYAANTVSSRLCQGRDREEASAAIEQAAAEYEAIRQAIEAEQGEGDALQEEDPKFSLEMSKRLRSLGKGLALTAAKLARSCATGQQTVTALMGGRQTGAGAPASRSTDRALPVQRGQAAGPLLLPSKAQSSRYGRLFTRFLEDAGLFSRFATVNVEDRGEAAITLKNAPWQDLAIEWVITPELRGWPAWKLSMAHYTDQNGDRLAELEVLFLVRDGQISDHAFIKAGGFDTQPGPDNPMMKIWLTNLRDQGFVEAALRQLGLQDKAASPGCACSTGGAPTVAKLVEDKSYRKPTDVNALKKLLAGQDFTGNRRRALRDWVVAAFTFLLREVKPAQVDVTLGREGAPDRVEVDVERDWKADAELVSQLGRQVGIQVFARFASAARAAASRPEADHKHGRLVVVPIFGVPKTAGELRDHLTSATSAFKQDPSIRLAKRWVKTALQRLELEPGDIKGNNDGAIGVYVIHVSLKSDVSRPEVKARIALLQEAIHLAGVSFRVVLKGTVDPDAAVPKPTRERRSKATTANANASSTPPESSTDQGDVPADSAQDAIIMDAITSAIQKALGNGGN